MAGSTATQDSGSSVARLIASARESAGLTNAELADAVGIGSRQLQNWAAGSGQPGSARLRRLLDLKYVLDLVEEVYGQDGATMWLHARNRALEGRRPLDLITDNRADEVINLLDRIADGNM